MLYRGAKRGKRRGCNAPLWKWLHGCQHNLGKGAGRAGICATGHATGSMQTRRAMHATHLVSNHPISKGAGRAGIRATGYAIFNIQIRRAMHATYLMMQRRITLPVKHGGEPPRPRLTKQARFGYNKHRATHAPVAQLDRVSDSDSEGHAFESHRAYQAKRPETSVSGRFLSFTITHYFHEKGSFSPSWWSKR